MSRTIDQIEAELAAARETLEQRGRQINPASSLTDGSGVKCDFDLPYSSLPDIRSKKWLQDRPFS